MNLQRLLETAAAHAESRRFDEAAKICRRILTRDSDQPDANHFLGRILLDQGQVTPAIRHLAVTARVRPDDPAAHYHLAHALMAGERWDDAIDHLRATTRLDPLEISGHVDLGFALARRQRFREAAICFETAIKLEPREARALEALARIRRQDGDLDAALMLAKRANVADPAAIEPYLLLGRLHQDLQANGPAEEIYRAGLARAPRDVGLLTMLAGLIGKQGRVAEALALADQAIAVSPADPTPLSTRGTLRGLVGEIDAAIVDFEAAGGLERDPERAAELGSSALMLAQYQPSLDKGEISRRHREWARRHADPLAPPHPAAVIDRDPERRLRVGFISPDFNTHSVALFLTPLLESLDRRAFEVIAYAEGARIDGLTRRLRDLADSWRATTGISSAKVAEQIHADRIDILIDLAGHTAQNRLLVLARRPAPVQVTWLGYPGTTGMTAIDWRISDAVCDPAEDDALSAEGVWRLPQGFHAYVPPPDPLPVAPRDPQAPIRFGSFNNFSKYSSATFDLWASVLRAAPNAELVLKSSGPSSPEAKARIHGQFMDRGIIVARVRFLDHQASYRDHLMLYSGVDIGLDPTPYCGTTTTCEALWMGVPVITLRGDRHAARVGASLLGQVGLGDLIAENPESYVRIAVQLAADQARLAALRTGMRARLAASPLFDPAGFARRFETALREMWRARCARP